MKDILREEQNIDRTIKFKYVKKSEVGVFSMITKKLHNKWVQSDTYKLKSDYRGHIKQIEAEKVSYINKINNIVDFDETLSKYLRDRISITLMFSVQ